jgi:hypothetical protein
MLWPSGIGLRGYSAEGFLNVIALSCLIAVSYLAPVFDSQWASVSRYDQG